MRFLPIFIFVSFGYLLSSCGEKRVQDGNVYFTKADSLTDLYLRLQDSLHSQWNVMINDDNRKLNSMHSLLHELIVAQPEGMEQYQAFEERLNQLSRMRYTQKNMINEHVVGEYDFASNTLIVELISAAESLKQYSYNSTMQKLVDQILEADQNMIYYRMSYDSIALAYNNFLDQNREFLLTADESFTLEKKPLFQITLIK